MNQDIDAGTVAGPRLLQRLRLALLPRHGGRAELPAALLLALGGATTAVAAALLAGAPRALQPQLLLGLVVVALAAMLPVRVPGGRSSLVAATIAVWFVALQFGTAAAVVAAALVALIGSLRGATPRADRWVDAASAALALALAGSALQSGLAVLHARGVYHDALMFVGTAFVGIAAFVLDAALRAALDHVRRGERWRWPQFVGGFGWTGLVHALGVIVAALLYLGLTRVGMAVVLVAVPVIGMVLTMLHAHVRHRESDDAAQRERVEAAEREAAQAARHVLELEVSERRFHSAFSHAAIGMALVSTDGKVLQANPAMCHLLGRTDAEVIGAPFGDFVPAEDGDVLARLLEQVDQDPPPAAVELRCRHPDGAEVWVSMHSATFAERHSCVPCLILQAQDITARRDAELRLHRIAYQDSLTLLANRICFGQCLARAVERCAADRRHNFALMYLDFDRFKLINDTLGHAVGDEFLVEVARRIQSQVRPGDSVGRLGGDEFGILIEDIDGDQIAVAMAERLQETLSRPYAVGGTVVNSSASIGITFSSVGYDTPGDVLRDADIAMYRAKSGGRARYALFDASLRAQIADQLHLEGDLRRAIDGNELSLAYQPIYDLRSGRINSFEALLRWNHPERGLVDPELFLPIAEDSGLIGMLTEYVIDRACAQLAAWRADAGAPSRMRVQVNVSGTDLSRLSLVSLVTRALLAYGLEPWQLTLEITESTLMKRLDSALETMTQLRELGVGLSVDDFGTGYSSLSYLSTLPITSLKIDRSFVQRLQLGHRNSEVVKAIVTLGHSLGRAVIAEGIESPAQLSRLRDLDCGFGQGYLLSRPLDPDMALAWLKVEGPIGPAALQDSRWQLDTTGFGTLTRH